VGIKEESQEFFLKAKRDNTLARTGARNRSEQWNSKIPWVKEC